MRSPWSLIAYRNSCIAVCISSGVGDITCQALQRSGKKANEEVTDAHTAFDLHRTAAFAGAGLMIMGPLNHTIEVSLERLFPGISLLGISQKVLSRVVIAPAVIATQFAAVLVLQGATQDAIVTKVRSDVAPAWVTGTMFWPAASVLLYRFVPVHHRPGCGSVLGALWSTYLSFMAHRHS